LPAGASNVRRVGGGDINEAYHVVLADGREAFVKTRPGVDPGEYAAEAAGLRWLAASSPEGEPGALRTPEVLEVTDTHLALAWITPGALSGAGAEELGRGLALTHQAGAPCFGLAETDAPPAPSASPAPPASPARLGSLRLSNEPTKDWPSFYAQRRLLPLAEIAHERGSLSATGARHVQSVCERLAELAGPAEPPARLHGDLWSGNVMADDHGRPWLIDPSAFGGHREIDLAMLRLFGSPSQALFAAYEEVSPLADGWADRVELYQLLPLLIHAVLFAGSYTAAAERVARRYAA
jgi:fructosamine-3-kinase